MGRQDCLRKRTVCDRLLAVMLVPERAAVTRISNWRHRIYGPCRAHEQATSAYPASLICTNKQISELSHAQLPAGC